MFGSTWLLGLLAQYLIVAGTPFPPLEIGQERLLRVLSEVVTGPARGQLLALHLDAALPTHLSEAAMWSLRLTPHLTLNMHNTTRDSTHQAVSLLRYKRPLHILVWYTPLPEVLQALCYQWKPFNLLLLSLGPTSATSLLREQALHTVENVVSLELLPAVGNNSDLIGVFTLFPFSMDPITFLGHWERSIFGSWKALFPDRFPTLEGYTFHILSWLNDPPAFYGDASKPRGFSKTILEVLAAKINFTYTLTFEPPDLKWGSIENGSWIGILGMMARKEQNFSINLFTPTFERGQVFDPSVTTWVDTLSVFLQSPQQLPKWLSIFQPLSLFVVASLALITAIASASQALKGALVGQSMPSLPRAPMERVLLAVWLLCCLVFSAAYTSNLVGILTRPGYSRRLYTLQELVDSHHRIAVVDNGGFLAQELQTTQDPTLGSLRSKIDLFSLDDAVAALRQGSHAIIKLYSYLTLELYDYVEDDEWYAMKQDVRGAPSVWYFPKQTPWKYKFDKIILQLTWSGVIQHWQKVEVEAYKKYIKKRSNKRRGLREESRSPQALTLAHLEGVFYMVGFAWTISGFILLLEILKHRYRGHFVRRRC
ncbi:Glutamate receptor ionotropic, delta-1 [Chionoecetes opilio]|uniref:Glutamate receptor ionotropic, delta-1 n=1 Tax=Chionoecetes opilio TaxID=41210 RepID=A0A8J4YN02_CHIOP|nr:Glutamate receptor ionotropic, delta-1 [Chionoecetes opilio]